MADEELEGSRLNDIIILAQNKNVECLHSEPGRMLVNSDAAQEKACEALLQRTSCGGARVVTETRESHRDDGPGVRHPAQGSVAVFNRPVCQKLQLRIGKNTNGVIPHSI